MNMQVCQLQMEVQPCWYLVPVKSKYAQGCQLQMEVQPCWYVEQTPSVNSQISLGYSMYMQGCLSQTFNIGVRVTVNDLLPISTTLLVRKFL